MTLTLANIDLRLCPNRRRWRMLRRESVKGVKWVPPSTSSCLNVMSIDRLSGDDTGVVLRRYSESHVTR